MILALLLQTAAATPPARPSPPAQPPATMVVEPVAMMIATLDSDGDAGVTRAELEAGVRRSFEAADRARSGAIGYIAFADWAERNLGDRSALPSPFEVDADANDRITLAELQAAFGRLFTRFDRDADGRLVRAELLTIRSMAPPERQDRGTRPPRR